MGKPTLALPGIVALAIGMCGLIFALQIEEKHRRRGSSMGFALTCLWAISLLNYVDSVTAAQGRASSLLVYCLSCFIPSAWFLYTVPFLSFFPLRHRRIWKMIPLLPVLSCCVLAIFPSTSHLVLTVQGFELILGVAWVPRVVVGPVGAACLGFSLMLLGFAIMWGLSQVLRFPAPFASRALVILSTPVILLVVAVGVASGLGVMHSLWGTVLVGILGHTGEVMASALTGVWSIRPIPRRAFLDEMRDAAMIFDDHLHILEANRAARVFLGDAESALKVLDIYPDLSEMLLPLNENEKTITVECAGKTGFWRVRLCQVEHRGLEGPGWMLLFSDVTAERAASDLQTASLAELEGLISETRDGVAFVEPSGRTILWNNSLADLTGIPSDDALFQNIGHVHPELARVAGFNLDRDAHQDTSAYSQSLWLGREGERECRACVFPIRVSTDIVLVGILCRDLTVVRAAERQRERTIADLEERLAEVKALGGLLPVCGWCGKVRSDTGYWEKLDRYLASHAGARVSHGICPTCAEQLRKDAELAPGGAADG